MVGKGAERRGKHREGMEGVTQMMSTIQGDTSTHSRTYVFEWLPKLCELVKALFDDA